MGFPSWPLLPSAVGRTVTPGCLPPTLLQSLGWGPWRWHTGGSAGPGPLTVSPGEGVCSQEEQVLLPPRCAHQGSQEQGLPCAGEAWCTTRPCRCAGRESLGTRTRPRWHPRTASCPQPLPWAGWDCGQGLVRLPGRPAGQRAAVVLQGSWVAGEVAGSQAGTTEQ